MADEDDDPKLQEQNLEIRERLSSAYAALEGQRSVDSFLAFTFEDALDAQIERIEGEGTVLRPNELGRVDKIESDVIAAVAKVKAMPADAFVEPKDERDVNTTA